MPALLKWTWLVEVHSAVRIIFGRSGQTVDPHSLFMISFSQMLFCRIHIQASFFSFSFFFVHRHLRSLAFWAWAAFIALRKRRISNSPYGRHLFHFHGHCEGGGVLTLANCSIICLVACFESRAQDRRHGDYTRRFGHHHDFLYLRCPDCIRAQAGEWLDKGSL